MNEEEIKKLRFSELVTELNKFENCCVNANHLVVRDLKFWLNIQKEIINRIIVNGKDPNNETESQTSKKNCQWILLALQKKENIFPAGELPPFKFGTNYQLRD